MDVWANEPAFAGPINMNILFICDIWQRNGTPSMSIKCCVLENASFVISVDVGVEMHFMNILSVGILWWCERQCVCRVTRQTHGNNFHEMLSQKTNKNRMHIHHQFRLSCMHVSWMCCCCCCCFSIPLGAKYAILILMITEFIYGDYLNIVGLEWHAQKMFGELSSFLCVYVCDDRVNAIEIYSILESKQSTVIRWSHNYIIISVVHHHERMLFLRAMFLCWMLPG